MTRLQRILFVALILVCIQPSLVEAHDLIPRVLQEYVAQHPDATPEDIQAFANNQAPEYAQKIKNGADIIDIAQNQQTTPLDTTFDFLRIGIAHILTGPDHVLFILSLLLVFVSVFQTLKLITLFTVGHSCTLFLAVTGILTVSPRITEPLIALSIAYVALSSVFFRKPDSVVTRFTMPLSVFFFSLFHGLGFAGLLKEIRVPDGKFGLSLLSFNVGIEIGQLIVVVLVFPCIYLCRNKSWFPRVLQVVAVLISTIALYWFFERIFFPS